MNRYVALFVAFGFVLASGMVHGLWTSRWQQSEGLRSAVARLEDVPMTIGEWQGRPMEADAGVFKQAGAAGFWMRNYQVKRQAVTVILMCGPSGKMAVHTPEVCYQGAGYDILGSTTTHPVQTAQGAFGEFFTARFRKPYVGGASLLRIDWAWNATGTWQAPDSPRWTFRGEPFLYKLYLVRETQPGESAAAEPTLELLRQLLPVLNQALFPPSNDR
jgi:hypothetical protein